MTDSRSRLLDRSVSPNSSRAQPLFEDSTGIVPHFPSFPSAWSNCPIALRPAWGIAAWCGMIPLFRP